MEHGSSQSRKTEPVDELSLGLPLPHIEHEPRLPQLNAARPRKPKTRPPAQWAKTAMPLEGRSGSSSHGRKTAPGAQPDLGHVLPHIEHEPRLLQLNAGRPRKPKTRPPGQWAKTEMVPEAKLGSLSPAQKSARGAQPDLGSTLPQILHESRLRRSNAVRRPEPKTGLPGQRTMIEMPPETPPAMFPSQIDKLNTGLGPSTRAPRRRRPYFELPVVQQSDKRGRKNITLKYLRPEDVMVTAAEFDQGKASKVQHKLKNPLKKLSRIFVREPK